MKPKVILTIGGFDPGSGAGVVSDIKTFSNLGGYGVGVVCAITSQNSFEFLSSTPVSKKDFLSQFKSIGDDFKIDALKISMLPCIWMVDEIVYFINKYNLKNIVLDPVMVSKQGKVLTPVEVIERIKFKLLPLVSIVTPNIPEAEYISKMKINNKSDMIVAANKIMNIGVKSVLIKGGHLNGNCAYDLYASEKKFIFFKKRKISKINLHGTGCILSSCVSFYLANNIEIEKSVKKSISYVFSAIKTATKFGSGYHLSIIDIKKRKGV